MWNLQMYVKGECVDYLWSLETPRLIDLEHLLNQKEAPLTSQISLVVSKRRPPLKPHVASMVGDCVDQACLFHIPLILGLVWVCRL